MVSHVGVTGAAGGGYCLFPHLDVVHDLPLRVCAFGRDGHALAVRGDDLGEGQHQGVPFLVETFRGAGVDALEGYLVGILDPVSG